MFSFSNISQAIQTLDSIRFLFIAIFRRQYFCTVEAVAAFCRFAVKYQGNTRAYEKHTLVVSVLTQAASVKWPKRS